MKIYIDEKKCTGCGKCKTACPRGPKIYPIEEKNRKKSVYFEGLFMLSWLQDMCTICMEDTMPLRTHFKKRRIEKFVT